MMLRAKWIVPIRVTSTCVGTALTSSSSLGRASDGSRSGGSLHCGRKTPQKGIGQMPPVGKGSSPRDFAASCRHRALATDLLSRVRVEQQPGVCPRCGQALSPEDTIVFGHGLLGHLDCRRPRVLSAEERTLLFIYCRDHQVAECVRCTGKFRLREVASLDLLGIRSHGCPWCHTDLTDSIRAHLYGCAMLPVEVRRRAQAAREAARSLVKQSRQLSDAADVLL